MIEPIYCTWCDRVATHGRNGVGDGIYPTCGQCCDNCDERDCDYTPPKRPRKRAQARTRDWLDVCITCHATAPLFEPITHLETCQYA